jgi:aryl-alcohol dehydrogenase-like predicted oxidoreductase
VRRIALDRTDIVVSRLSFGTASLHHLPREAERQQLLAAASDAGITHFDTAPLYGYGLADEALGRFIGNRRSVTIASKVGLYPPTGASSWIVDLWVRKALGRWIPPLSRARVDWAVDRLERSVRDSLRRLQTDYIDVLFLHEPDVNLIQADEMRRSLERLREAGAVRYWGVAGEPATFAAWIATDDPLTTVVQTRDSLGLREADAVAGHRPLQFTYGYLSTASPDLPATDVIRGALKRNATGSILFSTRRAARVREIAGAVE